MTDVAHFYHLYAAGEWREPVAEHLAALEDGRYDGSFHVGLVGPPERRADALDELRCIRPPDSVIEADDGWEQVTLHPLRAYALKHPGVIIYAHTKGAANPNQINARWRRAMSFHVIVNWRTYVDQLGAGYDAIGCHWLTPDQYPGAVETPYFGGTYWMASADYLRRLPVCATTSRHDAEMWIGLADPKVLDLNPGWPGNYASVPKYRSLIAGR